MDQKLEKMLEDLKLSIGEFSELVAKNRSLIGKTPREVLSLLELYPESLKLSGYWKRDLYEICRHADEEATMWLNANGKVTVRGCYFTKHYSRHGFLTECSDLTFIPDRLLIDHRW